MFKNVNPLQESNLENDSQHPAKSSTAVLTTEQNPTKNQFNSSNVNRQIRNILRENKNKL